MDESVMIFIKKTIQPHAAHSIWDQGEQYNCKVG